MYYTITRSLVARTAHLPSRCHSWRHVVTIFAIVAGLPALSPVCRAVTPAPDGGYAGQNTAEGTGALLNLSTGTNNSAVGYRALRDDTTGSNNTATGSTALEHNTGNSNTAMGSNVLSSNTYGAFNTAVGASALTASTNGSWNTAVGASALFTNGTGAGNCAVGSYALENNTAGTSNTAMGYISLRLNTTGNSNTAVGDQTLFSNTTAAYNAAFGSQALNHNSTGSNNTAIGANALVANTTGENNVAMGGDALLNNTNGSNNTALGFGAGTNLTTGNNNIEIGNNGVAGESNTIRIGNSQTRAYIAGVRGVTTGTPTAIPVVIGAAGQLGTMSSSRRFKDKIKPMEEASQSILDLQPVTFHYKSDEGNTPQFGLIAEEVEKVNPDLVVRNPDGSIYTVRYDAINAMLLNEFLKEHKKAEAQEHKVGDLESVVARQQKQIETLTAGLQKVSDEIQLGKPNPELAANPR
jgi:hypothetical protein